MLLQHLLHPANVCRSTSLSHLYGNNDGFVIELTFDHDVDLAVDA